MWHNSFHVLATNTIVESRLQPPISKISKEWFAIAISTFSVWYFHNCIRLSSMFDQVFPVWVYNNGLASGNDQQKMFGSGQGNIHSSHIAVERQVWIKDIRDQWQKIVDRTCTYKTKQVTWKKVCFAYLKKPIPWLPAARTAEKMTICASLP